MSEYNCLSCEFSTHLKTNFSRHLKTSKHLAKCESSKGHPIPENNTTLISEVKHICKYCNKGFAYKQGLHKHVKNVCKKRQKEDMKEYTRLLNAPNKTAKSQKEMNRLATELQIENNITGSKDVQLVNFHKTDYESMSNNIYKNSAMRCNSCVITFVKYVHFNDAFPQNQNIYISNLSSGHISIYQNDRWEMLDRKVELDNFYDNIQNILDDWARGNKSKYPMAYEKFQQYLSNIDTGGTEDHLKKLFEYSLYNDRPEARREAAANRKALELIKEEEEKSEKNT